MTWYDPRTWFSSESTTTETIAAPAEQPLGGPYGGRRKTRRATKKVKKSKRSRTGKTSSRS